MKEDCLITVPGLVIHQSKNALVVVLDSGPQIRATLAGRLQQHGIRVIPGDRVSAEMSSDMTMGRVVYRFREQG